VANSIITLTSDYGTNDHLVGTVKGVILNINPDASIVDITHNVPPYDVLDGALAIGSAYRYFPPKTIHLVIVDPGVGTARRPLLVRAGTQYFIAPDNGVLSMVYDREASLSVYHLTTEHYHLRPVSRTFHGRDIFAPVAAWLSKAWQPQSMGEAVTDFKRLALPKPKSENGAVTGMVLRIDNFGNLLTNLTPGDFPEEILKSGTLQMRVNDREVKRLVANFAQGEPGEPVAIIGSSGYIEIAVNKGNAARLLAAQRGASVTLVTS
jgi:S-adenosyl-L-methionine hydrolase (adenosine-forming)